MLLFVVHNKLQKDAEKIGGGAVVSCRTPGNLVYIENYAGHGTEWSLLLKLWLDMLQMNSMIRIGEMRFLW